MTTSNRISKIIDSLEISQAEFANTLKITPAYVSKIINKGATPSDRLIDDICEKYGIRKEWLLTGEEPMKAPVARDIQIERFVGEALHGETDNFKRRLISVLANLSESEWEVLEQKARELAGMKDE